MVCQEIKTPNARLIYRKMSGVPKKWQQGLGEVEKFIADNPRLNFASEQIYLYFFAPSQEFGEDYAYWVGREVIGFVGKLPKNVGSYDLSSGICYSYGPFTLETLQWEEIKEIEKAARSEGSMADTWRLYLAESKIWLQIFKKES